MSFMLITELCFAVTRIFFFCIRTQLVRKRIRRIFRSRFSSSILSFSVPSGPGAKVLTFRVLCPPISHSCLILSYQYLKCKRKERADAPEHLPFFSACFLLRSFLEQACACGCRLLYLMAVPCRCAIYSLLCSVVT